MIGSPPIDILDDLAVASYDDTRTPLHEVVRSGLSRVIDEHFADGQRFWTEAEVQDKLNVSRVTVRRALAALADQGCLVRHRSRGTFVRYSGPDTIATRPMQRCAIPISIGVFVPYLGSAFWSEVIDELTAVAVEAGMSFHVYTCEPGESGESIIAQLSTLPGEEAIILLGSTHKATDDLYRLLSSRGYYVITVDSPLRGLPAPFVGVDNDMGVYMGVRYLVELGHRRITMLNYEPPHFVNTQLRVNAFLSVAADNGLSEARVYRVDLSLAGGKSIPAAMEAIWGDVEARPTALFCDSSGSSVGALKWCAEQGIAIPRDLSILGFDNTRQVQFSRPPLTCVAQPLKQIAKVALELIRRAEAHHVLLPPTLIVRDSTAPIAPIRQ